MATEAQIKVTVDSSQAERALGNLQDALKGLAAITIGTGIIAGLSKLAIEATDVTNKLLSVSDSLEEANAKFYLVGQTAMKTGSSIGGTADLYQKLAMSATFAGSSTQSLLGITEAFNKTLQISGASGAAAASALYQFAQAAQKGSLNGDEFRVIAETNGYILKILAKELKVTQSELRQMASDGQLSIEVIGKALLNSTEIAKDYSKAIKTIPQAMENLNTSVMMSVKALDDATGASQAVAKAIMVLANNIPIVISALAGLAAAFVIINFGAIVSGVRALTLAFVGLGVSLGPVGIALTALAAVGTYFGMNKAIDDAKKKTEELNKANDKGLKVNHQRAQAALDLDKALEQQIATMAAAHQFDKDYTGVRNAQFEIDKAIALEKVKYLKTNEKIKPELEAQLRVALANKIADEERKIVTDNMVKAKSQQYTLSILDVDQQKIATQMEQFRLSVTEATYNKEKDRYEQQLKINQAKEIEMMMIRGTSSYQSESQKAQGALQIYSGTQAGIKDAADKQRQNLKYLVDFQMSEIDKMEKSGVLSAQQAADMRIRVKQEAANQELLINDTLGQSLISQDQKVAEARMRSMGVTNTAIIDSVKGAMANIKMMQQGGIVGAQGLLGAMDQVFGAMAGSNKQAFEMHKKLAVAQALISTYQAAAVALATYPPPFGFVAAAVAVAAGLAQVAMIRNQQYSGRALGGPVMGNTPYIVGERGPELFTPATSGRITSNQNLQGGSPTNINFTIVANDTTGFDNLLNSRKGMIKQLISDAMLDKGQRF